MKKKSGKYHINDYAKQKTIFKISNFIEFRFFKHFAWCLDKSANAVLMMIPEKLKEIQGKLCVMVIDHIDTK